MEGKAGHAITGHGYSVFTGRRKQTYRMENGGCLPLKNPSTSCVGGSKKEKNRGMDRRKRSLRVKVCLDGVDGAAVHVVGIVAPHEETKENQNNLDVQHNSYYLPGQSRRKRWKKEERQSNQGQNLIPGIETYNCNALLGFWSKGRAKQVRGRATKGKMFFHAILLRHPPIFNFKRSKL
ncbi:hypothetical protein SUGI_0014500 [Cryptomeria japonica]|nr:hypothetical protein SUGI_0014500 [Cryptomeria japonica]